MVRRRGIERGNLTYCSGSVACTTTTLGISFGSGSHGGPAITIGGGAASESSSYGNYGNSAYGAGNGATSSYTPNNGYNNNKEKKNTQPQPQFTIQSKCTTVSRPLVHRNYITTISLLYRLFLHRFDSIPVGHFLHTVPQFPKTVIESNLKLPALKLKINSSPDVKVMTNSRDPLEMKDEVDETNTDDIFKPPKP